MIHSMIIPGKIAAFMVFTILVKGFFSRIDLKDYEDAEPVLSTFTSFRSALNEDLIYNDDDDDNNAPPMSPRVQVDVYVESLCIDSQDFVLNDLVPTYQTLGAAVMDLTVVSFGNAKYQSKEDSSLTCQHGIAECDANAYNLCAADVYDNRIERYLPYVTCLFEQLPMGHQDSVFDSSVFASCARHSALNWSLIQHCHADQNRVARLQKQAYKMTPVDHKYVPWVVIDGDYWDEDNGTSLQTKVCQQLIEKGGSNPACAMNTASITMTQQS